MRNRWPAEVLVKLKSCADVPDRMPMPDTVFVNAKFCVESPSRIRVPVEVLVKLKSCEDVPDRMPIPEAVFVNANV